MYVVTSLSSLSFLSLSLFFFPLLKLSTTCPFIFFLSSHAIVHVYLKDRPFHTLLHSKFMSNRYYSSFSSIFSHTQHVFSRRLHRVYRMKLPITKNPVDDQSKSSSNVTLSTSNDIGEHTVCLP